MKRILPLLAAVIALTTVLPGKAQTGKYYIDGRETTREELLKLPAGAIESMANSVENGLPVVRIKLKPEGGEQAPATGQQEKNAAPPHEKAMQLVRGIYEQHTLLKEGDLAADFRAAKYAGGDLTLTALRGKVVLLNFWATWCGPCRAFGPTFEKASEANPDIYFAKVDIDQNPDLASAAKVQAVPTLMVIKNQQIVFQQAGALRASDLDDLIAQAKELDVNAAAAEEATEQAQ